MSNDQLVNFSAHYDKDKFDKHIFLLTLIEPNVFYLPHKNNSHGYSDSEILPFPPNPADRINTQWQSIQYELQKQPFQFQRDQFRIPASPYFFYDPFSERVCENFNTYVQPAVENITADVLILEVTAIVIRLHLLGVPDDESLQLLRHASSFVFNGIRCKRKNHRKLYVSRVFYPAYYEAFQQLTMDVDREAVPPIPMHVMRAHVEQEVKILSYFRGWGRISFFGFEGDKMVYRNIGFRIFEKEILDSILYDMRIAARTSQNGSIAAVIRHNSCKDPYYWNDKLNGCCGTICKNTKLLKTAGSLTVHECCKICNSKSCAIYGTPLEKLSRVVLEKYGYSSHRAINVLI